MLDPRLLEVLVDPEDKGSLIYSLDENCLYNPRLRRRYQIRNDIPVLLVEDSQIVDDATHDLLTKKENHG